ncbi:uncharacterized protein LOC62_05G007556 [Vanrija pseudolonga]|uniref:Uncharacterized protein n=1 Tax=Vanrija pseudolonga TaxID=143232 RepID=A0AAF0YFI6_9TREE|nr:hypothetical protein LOC62_05G007556 [Vanrija pseudolonga]
MSSSSSAQRYRALYTPLLPAHRYHDFDHVKRFIDLTVSEARTGAGYSGAAGLLQALREDLVENVSGITRGLRYLDAKLGADEMRSANGEDAAPPAYSRSLELQPTIPPEATSDMAIVRIAELEARVLQLSRDAASANIAREEAETNVSSLHARAALEEVERERSQSGSPATHAREGKGGSVETGPNEGKRRLFQFRSK